MFNRKEYEKNCKRFDLEPFTEEERIKFTEDFKKELLLNGNAITGYTGIGSYDNLPSKLITLQMAGKREDHIYLYDLNPCHIYRLGYMAHVKKPYIYQGYWYVSCYGTNRIYEVISGLSQFLFNDYKVIKMY